MNRINNKAGIVALMLGTMVTASQATLVSQWNFENNLLDSVGPNNGIDNGGLAYAPGVSGQGLLMNGTDFMSVANPVTGGLQSVTGFTVAAWIRMDQNSTGFVTGSIFNLRTAASNNSGFTLEQASGSANTLSFAVNTNGTTSFNALAVGGWNLGQVYHVAASFDAASHTMKLYRNGALIGSATSTNTTMTADASSAFQIGNNIVNNSKWIGLVDDARVYNTALTDSQVGALVPEPASIVVIGLGIAGFLRRRKVK